MSAGQFAPFAFGIGVALGLALLIGAFLVGALVTLGVRTGNAVFDRIARWRHVRRETRYLDEDYEFLCEGEEETA